MLTVWKPEVYFARVHRDLTDAMWVDYIEFLYGQIQISQMIERWNPVTKTWKSGQEALLVPQYSS